MAGLFDGAEVIHSYTREQAIADGVLKRVDRKVSREAGLGLEVAITAAAWAAYVTVPARCTSQDESGRLWDVLWMLRCAIIGAPRGERELLYSLHVVTEYGKRAREVTLKCIAGPDDEGMPCLTIMLPEED